MTITLMTTLLIASIPLALWRARIYLKARVRRFEESKKAAWICLQTGSGGLPSWTRNEERLSDFLFTVQKLALRKGVPHQKVLEALAAEHVLIQLISFAGALELRNVTFAEQQLAVAETIVQRFDYDERMRAASKILFSDCRADQTEHEGT
jgi:hypothetical protein